MAEAQVFVRRTDLILDPVPVIAYYEEAVDYPIDYHGADCTRICLPVEAIDRGALGSATDPFVPPRLVSNFRSQWMDMMVNDEASRRIDLSFPDYMQRNGNADINNSLTKYGPDQATWPTDAKNRKSEND